MHHCVQMKPADSENKCEDRKLFVGMISKKLTEQDIRMMFCKFGTIEECRVSGGYENFIKILSCNKAVLLVENLNFTFQ